MGAGKRPAVAKTPSSGSASLNKYRARESSKSLARATARGPDPGNIGALIVRKGFWGAGGGGGQYIVLYKTDILYSM